MYFIVRRKLAMAADVREFIRAHADPNPGFIAAASRFEERYTRAEELARQEVSGRQAVAAAIASRDLIKAQAYDALRLLAGIARAASKEEPELLVGIARPNADTGNQTFVTRGRVAQATAVAHQALLEKYGMPAACPADLGVLLDRFEAAMQDKSSGKASHTGARADLAAVTFELMDLVRQLDALIRYRFRNDPEALGAWKSARNMAWPERTAGTPTPAEQVQSQVQPAK